MDIFQSFSHSHVFWISIVNIWGICVFKLYLLLRQNTALRNTRHFRQLREHFLKCGLADPAQNIGSARYQARQNIQANLRHILYMTLRSTNLTLLLLNLPLYGIHSYWIFTERMVRQLNEWLWPPYLAEEVWQTIFFKIFVDFSFVLIKLPILVLERHHSRHMTLTTRTLLRRIVSFTFKTTLWATFAGIIVLIYKLVPLLHLMIIVLLGYCVFTQIQPEILLRTRLYRGLYTRLQGERICRKITQLAITVGFPPERIYIFNENMDAIFAQYHGLYLGQSVVLSKKLIQTINVQNEDEIAAVISHELGHWKLHHMLKYFVFVELDQLLHLFAFYYLHQNQDIFSAAGFPKNYPNPYPLYIGYYLLSSFVLVGFTEVMRYIGNFICRRFELESDKFAAEMGYSQLLKRALIKVDRSPGIADNLYSSLEYNHPVLLQRLEALDAYDNENQTTN